jgi:hypothetical protein
VKIICLFVRHGAQRYPDALDRLDAWYRRHGLLSDRTLWIIDNSLPPESPPVPLGAGATVRAGDNRAWEFSGWSRALRELREARLQFDVIHFVTSAFETLYTGYLQHFQPGMLRYVVTTNACLGHIDGGTAIFRLGDTSSATWIRTCFFFVPALTSAGVSPWVAYRDPAAVFVRPDSREFRSDAPLDASYQDHLTQWLQGGEIGGYQWHSPVAAGETPRFQAKVLAILNEHRLSTTMRAAGIRLVDFCWLYAQRPHSPAAWPTPPPEQEQLRVRRRVLGIPDAGGTS